MDRPELIKQAFVEAMKGYIVALHELELEDREIGIDEIAPLSALTPMAAQVYRQLSSVVYIKMPPYCRQKDYDMVSKIMEESGVNAVIMPDVIKITPTEDDQS